MLNSSLMHGHPQSWAREGESGKHSKMLSRAVIYALFSKHSLAYGGFAPRPPLGFR